MSYKIVPQLSNAIFEPHTMTSNNSPYLYWHTVIAGPSKRNVHKNLEFVYYINGSATVHLGNEQFRAEPGDVAVVNSYYPHHWVPDSVLEGFCLIIDDSFCKYNHIDPRTIHFSEIIRDRQLQQIMNNLIPLFSSHAKFRDAEIRLTLLELLLYLCKHHSTDQLPSEATSDTALERISSAIAYIKNNLSEKLTVDDIANAVGLSRYYFMREFKRFTGHTLTGYINIIRCEHAKTLLETGNHRIKDIAAICGFENESYFTNVFKKYTGMPPSAFVRSTISTK